MSRKTKSVTIAGMIAALYVILTMVSTSLGLSSGAIQLRLSEALCILPIFTPFAIPGLTIGCLISNIMSGCIIWDVIWGSVATLLGAIGTYLLRKRKFIPVLPPIIANTIIIPLVLKYAYHLDDAILYFVLTIGIGELLSCGVLGSILYNTMNTVNIKRFL